MDNTNIRCFRILDEQNKITMKLSQLFLEELKQAANTRRILAAVPLDKGDFKPHEKSFSLKRLAVHVAEINGWWKETLLQDELDFSKGDYKPVEINTTEDLLALHDRLVANAEKILSEVSEEEFAKSWSMRNGEQVYFTMPKGAVARTWCLNHLYHHRAQLTVYFEIAKCACSGNVWTYCRCARLIIYIYKNDIDRFDSIWLKLKHPISVRAVARNQPSGWENAPFVMSGTPM